jgi:nickel/cobalt transporter (NicO) family protein
MTEFSTLLQQGTAWLFVPSAILLGVLHGLEPGHSKTMMAAFIIAVRGTMTQAILLGLSATISHTAVVWAVAMAGLYFGNNWSAEATEPYLQVASAVLIIGVAIWMVWRTWRNEHAAHDHNEAKHIDTVHGIVRLEVFEDAVSPRFRLYRESGYGRAWAADEVRIETERTDNSRQIFSFVQREGFVESEQGVIEPHEFVVRLRLGREHHSHDFDIEFVEHDHHRALKDYDSLDVSAQGYQDPHELAHANDIRRRFAYRQVTTSQIIMFGLTGGLIPCPASITVLLLCLQLKKVALGATLVLCFSIGLAVTMVAAGALAALGVKHVSKSWSGFGEFSRKAPYLSGMLITLVGLYVGYQGVRALI